MNNKKYTIINTSLYSSNFCIDNFFYIVIFILLVYLAIQIIFVSSQDNFSNYKDYFDVVNATNTTAISSPATSTSPQNILNTITDNGALITTNATIETPTSEMELQNVQSQVNALKMSKQALEENMKNQARAYYLSNNYYKIDDSSFNNELSFINDDFIDIRLPQSDFNGKSVISTNAEWNDIVSKANSYKNLYNPGDIVIKPSEYNITKDTICYKDYETHLLNDPNFKKKHPECMVCSVNPESDYKNTKSWKNTKTNIHKVCLFDPNAPANSAVLNYDGCRKLCKLN